ncbi:MAG: sulfotransferase [Proteobacteria bacterium]|nr:sulfotransferase [Pseudomonadota bacterium]MBU1715990.1 sulfotransferase [Pseudomonadota bacterium]
MNSAPIFIIGTERSGSNLLRLMLNAHSSIAVPHPPHILKFFSPLEKGYGDLAQPENLKKLVDDILGLLAVHIYPWKVQPEPAEIIATTRTPDLIGIFFSIYQAYLKQCGKKRWGCKSTFMIHHIPRVLAVCPSAKFLFLVRDPRDVAASSRKAIFSPFHPYFTARLWRCQQLAGLHFYDSAPGSCCLVRYEELIAEPEKTVRMICEFLEEEYEPAMLEFYKTSSARKSEGLSESWKNTASPVLAGNKNNYLTALSPAEIRLVEEVTGDLMLRLGYLLSGPKTTQQLAWLAGEIFLPPKPSCPVLWHYYLLNFYWTVKVEIRAMLHDRNYRQFWRRRIFLLGLRLRFLGRLIFSPSTIAGKA